MGWTLKSSCLTGVGKIPALSNRRDLIDIDVDLEWIGNYNSFRKKAERNVNHFTVKNTCNTVVVVINTRDH